MKYHEFRYKKWFVKYSPDDGARLAKISFNRFDLVTTKPESFKAPKEDYGLYETRRFMVMMTASHQ